MNLLYYTAELQQANKSPKLFPTLHPVFLRDFKE